jgi:large-conductance mechanosensitive channel
MLNTLGFFQRGYLQMSEMQIALGIVIGGALTLVSQSVVVTLLVPPLGEAATQHCLRYLSPPRCASLPLGPQGSRPI